MTDKVSSMKQIEVLISLKSKPRNVKDLTCRFQNQGMRNNIASCSSGYTGNFYKAFWPILKQRLMHAIHRTKDFDCLSLIQKIGIVQIIPKAEKKPKIIHKRVPSYSS